MSYDNYAFYTIPQNEQTPELCLSAVKIDPISIIHISPQLITTEIASISLSDNFGLYKFIPKHILTYEFMKKVLHINPNIFRKINKSEQTYELCMICVSSIGELLQYVREDIINYDLCLCAVINDSFAIQYCGKYIDENICKIAVSDNGVSIMFIKDEFRTQEIIKLAIKSTFHAIKYLYENEINEDIIMHTIKIHPNCKSELMKIVNIVGKNILIELVKNNKISIEI